MSDDVHLTKSLAVLRREVQELKTELSEAHATIAQLRADLDRAKRSSENAWHLTKLLRHGPVRPVPTTNTR